MRSIRTIIDIDKKMSVSHDKRKHTANLPNDENSDAAVVERKPTAKISQWREKTVQRSERHAISVESRITSPEFVRKEDHAPHK